MKCSKGKRGIVLGCMLLVVGLSACNASDAVVTSDDLQPSSNVEAALAQQAGGGQNYQYVWMAEDVDATMEQYRIEYTQKLDEMFKDAQSGEQVTQEEYSYDDYKAAMEEELEFVRQELEEEHLLDPVVSAQEAANLAGRILEENYGIDLSQRELRLSCANGLVNNTERLQWRAILDEDADGSLFSSSAASVMLDATTGEIVVAEYYPSAEEYEDMRSNLPACYRTSEDPDVEGVYGFYDVEDPSFPQFRENIAEQIRASLTQSVLAEGAAVRDIEVSTTDGAVKNEYLSVSITYDNGNTALLTMLQPYVCVSEYPLRGFQYGNLSYGKA